MPKTKQLYAGNAEPMADMHIAILNTTDYEVDPHCPHCANKQGMDKLIDIEEDTGSGSMLDLVLGEAILCPVCGQATILVDLPYIQVEEPVFLYWQFMKFLTPKVASDLEDDEDRERAAEANRTGSNVLALPSPL